MKNRFDIVEQTIATMWQFYKTYKYVVQHEQRNSGGNEIFQAKKFQISFSIKIEATNQTYTKKRYKNDIKNDILTIVHRDKYTIVYKKNLIVYIYDKWDMVHKYLCWNKFLKIIY